MCLCFCIYLLLIKITPLQILIFFPQELSTTHFNYKNINGLIWKNCICLKSGFELSKCSLIQEALPLIVSYWMPKWLSFLIGSIYTETPQTNSIFSFDTDSMIGLDLYHTSYHLLQRWVSLLWLPFSLIILLFFNSFQLT